MQDTGPKFSLRYARPSDAGALLELMLGLARFEGYADRFRVTERDLLERGLDDPETRQFTAFVAELACGVLAGYAVVYEIPFTFDLQPNLVLKELYVREDSRTARVMEFFPSSSRESGDDAVHRWQTQIAERGWGLHRRWNIALAELAEKSADAASTHG